jgi:hypothetical protein
MVEIQIPRKEARIDISQICIWLRADMRVREESMQAWRLVLKG